MKTKLLPLNPAIHKLVSIWFIFISLFFYGQEVPPVNTFTSEDYQAENQNWCITQADNKFIYVANNAGLLEFNGESWQLYKTPNATIMRSVKWHNNKVYSGFYMDFGYWEKNSFGTLIFTSLVKKYGIEMLEDEQIWEIVELEGFLLFKSLSRIYILNLTTETFKTIQGKGVLTKLSKVNNTIYFQDLGHGIFKIEKGTAVLVSANELFLNKRIIEIFEKNQDLYFITQKDGVYYLDDAQLKKWSFSSSNKLENKTIYSAKILQNGNIVIGTISNGLIKIKSDGEFYYNINYNNGLTNNTILNIFEDENYNLWLGLDNGINIVNSKSPFKLGINKNNFWGTIYASIIVDNLLYIGTNQGLYVKPLNKSVNFKLIENTQGQVWNLQNINNELFCSHDSGTFIIKGKEAQRITTEKGTWGVKLLAKNTILQGSYDGLSVLKKKNNRWVFNNKLKGFSNSSKSFVVKGNQIFVNHEYKGVFRLNVNSEFTKVKSIEKEVDLKKGIHSNLIEFENKILFSSKRGVFIYNEDNKKFQRDSLYSQLVPENNFLSAKLLNDKANNKLWSFTKSDIRYLSKGKLSNIPELHVIPLSNSIQRGATGYENLTSISENNYFIGTSNGYLLVNTEQLNDPNNFRIHINKILNKEKDKNFEQVELNSSVSFQNSKNNIQFYYSVPNYQRASSLKYQYKLEGFNAKWSEFTTSNSVVYENLPSKDFVFKVRAIVDNKLSENEASFKFSVDKPWYLSNVAILIYVLFLLLLAYLWFYFSNRYYKNQKIILLEKAQRELELREIENERKLVKLNNEKLRADIDNKNRELATSTMSIIKKNEFLNTIKSELLNGKGDNIDTVVKIIDKNLNNTDDWNLFQEAFNNADKNFLKKIRKKHSNLTPNDLRLCAYLRLNLSSKEIAPLLNISPRSVEVKRYRLRKKMQLEHNDNLTDYILSL